jgi:hypothetical protein
MKRTAFAILAASAALTAVAHPHFPKMQATKVTAGEFVSPRRPTLKLSAELKTATATIPAGDYTIGVIKNSDKDWTMALFPGAPERGKPVDMAKVIKLDSMFEGGKGTAEHMLVDVTPGHGKFEGKAVLTLHFGTLFLSGALA